VMLLLPDPELASLVGVCLHEGSSPLHCAAKHLHLETCQLLCLHGADANLANNNELTPVDLVPAHLRHGFEELRQVSLKGFATFISHFKAEGQTEARNLKEMIESRLRRKVFLDSDDLLDLADLCNSVRDSDTLVLLLTRGVLTRPWVLVELMTAFDEGVPVITVIPIGNSKEIAYDYAEAQRMFDNWEDEVEMRNPGVMVEVRKNYRGKMSLEKALERLRTEIPAIISKRVDYSMSKRVLTAMLDDVAEAVQLQGAKRLRVRMLASHQCSAQRATVDELKAVMALQSVVRGRAVRGMMRLRKLQDQIDTVAAQPSQAVS